jgi:hypothetical protein
MLPLGCQRPSELGAVANLDRASKIRDALKGDGGGAAAAAAPVGTGWATLKGTFTFAGDPPQMPPYGVNKDHEICAPGGEAPPQELLVVDPATKGVANIAIYARDVSRVHEESGPSAEELVFDQKVCVFLTHVFGMTVNQPVSIKNSDPVGHNTKIDGQNFFNQTIESGGAVPWTAQREEALPQSVKCSIHPWMQAYILPRENQYFAVTAKDGTFEIPNLPAGEKLELQIWHEYAAGGSLVVDSPEAKELKWSKKGRITVTLEENETREITIAVPPTAFRAG